MSGMQKGKEFPFLKWRKFSWIVFYGIFLKVLKSCFFFFPLLEVSVVLKISVLKNCDSTLWKFEYPAFPFHHCCQGFSLGSFLVVCYARIPTAHMVNLQQRQWGWIMGNINPHGRQGGWEIKARRYCCTLCALGEGGVIRDVYLAVLGLDRCNTPPEHFNTWLIHLLGAQRPS